MAKLSFVLAVAVAGCSTVASTVPPTQRNIPDESGIVVGRLGFVARKKIALQQFRMAAVSVPDGDRYWIHALGSEGEDTGSFYVNLPRGHYRLTKWQASAPEGEWAGEDAGLSIEVLGGQVVCVGALYFHPREKQVLRLEEAQEPKTLVRDECEKLGESFHQRSPSLTRAALIRVAQPVGHPGS